MVDRSLTDVAQILEGTGLTGPAFDVATVERLLAASLSAGEVLDRLLDSTPVEDPTAFIPDWL